MTEQLKKTTELNEIAYHEAGHAVMAYLLHRRFYSITIDSEKLDDGTGGLVRLTHSKQQSNSFNQYLYSKELEKYIRITLAGEAAIGIFSGQEKWDMSQSDIGICFRLAQDQCICLKETDAYINCIMLSVRKNLKLPHNWACVCAVAQALLEHKTLGYRKTREIIKAAYNEYNMNPSFESSFLEEPDESDESVDFYF